MDVSTLDQQPSPVPTTSDGTPTHLSLNTVASPSRTTRDRVKVSRACDRCKGKKIRCTGKQPCSLCTRLGLECEFRASYRRGKVPLVRRDDSQITHASYQTGIDCLPEVDPDPQILATHERQRVNTTSAIPSSRNSPEPPQTDLQGHYVGPSSGASFLLRAQKRLHSMVALSRGSSIFTFGDAPLPEFDASFLILPAKEEADCLIGRYFDYAVPTHRFLYRPAVEKWMEELYSNSAPQDERTRGRRAVVFMVFAQASEYLPTNNASSHNSARYFEAAEQQLKGEVGAIRLTSVQARLCQCFFLLSESRINHCWSLFGTTAHLLLALGLHRKRRRDAASIDVEDECRRRVFWSAYVLDCYLSAALGRPRTFHNDDTDQELPSLIDDNQLARSDRQPCKSQNIMLASIYHARLAKIISLILKDIYSINPPSPTSLEQHAKKYNADLRNWRNDIAHFIDVDVSLLSMLFGRQSTVLRLAYSHAQILLNRPFLLRSFADLTRKQTQSTTIDQDITAGSIKICLEGAMTITAIVNDLCETKQNYRALWFTHYYAFCAIVVLYVYTIRCKQDQPETWKHYFIAAERCQQQICKSDKGKDSLLQRYNIVLEELRLEVLNQIPNAQQIPSDTRPELQIQERAHQTVNHEREREIEVASTILGLYDHNIPLAPQSTVTNLSQDYGLAATTSAFNEMARSSEISLDQHSMNSNPQVANFSNAENFIYHPVQPNVTGDTILEDLTGWGDFDSLVMGGMHGIENTADLQGMNGEDWTFSGPT
ncbi:hypothetical protein BP5796_07735 [Coleophoma crateriformis]|uniref:Zn(2)-C6 fungal-type domain-containing protein n=1 Tax=Coleophoma crateriformis TaxID=565419 RepID=A0A3D8RCT4_9HELO|nr:hypothetical protein BP5796_07735 [Coleophoma crateriformis]